MTHKKIYIIDRYTNKNLWMQVNESEQFTLGEKIAFAYTGGDGKQNMSIGTYIGERYKGIDREAKYEWRLTAEEIEEFDMMQAKAREKFPMFKKDFREAFPEAIPVTARYHMFAQQRYFYFYAEQRFLFTEFIKMFREKLGSHFFLFQVGARDMVKMSPATDHIIGCNGRNLCCKSNRPLPSIDIEDLLIQHLTGRDVERLKGRCGKLKCSLMYEVETYLSESKKFPKRWSKIEVANCDKCGMVTNFNIMTNKIDVVLDEGNRIQINLEEVKKIYENKNTKMSDQYAHELVGDSASLASLKQAAG